MASRGARNAVSVVYVIVDEKGAVLGTRRVEQSMRRVRRQQRFVRRNFAVMGRALVSMLGVLVAFNLLITLPQQLLLGLTKAFLGGIKLIAAFEERVISLQGLLATLIRREADAGSNFASMGAVATAVMDDLLRKSALTVASVEETSLVLQTMFATGAQDFVNNMQEAVDLSILLANAISAVTVGQDRSRQLAEETRSFFTGQLRPTALLTRLLFRNRTELERFKSQARDSGEFLELMRKKLSGFVEAAEMLGFTLTGILTQLIDLGTRFSRIAFGAAFNRARLVAKDFFRFMDQNLFLVEKTAHAIGSSIEALLVHLGKVIVREFFGFDIDQDGGLKEFLEYLSNAAPDIAGKLARLGTEIIQFIAGLIPLLIAALDVIILIVDAIKFLVVFAVEGIGILKKFGSAIYDTLAKSAGHPLGFLAGLVENMPELGDAANSFFSSLMEGYDALAPFRDRALADMKRLYDSLIAARDAAADPKSNLGVEEQVAKRARELTEANARAYDELATKLVRLRDVLVRYQRINVHRLINAGRDALDAYNISARQSIDLMRDLTLIGTDSNETFRNQVAAMGFVRLETKQTEHELSRLRGLYNELVAVIQQVEDDYGLTSEEGKAYLRVLDQLNAAIDEQAQKLRDLHDEALKPLRATWTSLLDDLEERLWIMASQADTVVGLLIGVWDTLVQWLKDNFVSILKEIGSAITQVFKDAFAGRKTISQSMKDFAADLIEMAAQIAIQWGTIMVIMGLLTLDFKQAALGAALLAAGIAALAVAARIRGGGNRVGASAGGGTAAEPSFAFNQAQIDVQQQAVNASMEMTAAAKDLSSAAMNLEGMQMGDVVTIGGQQAGGFTALVARDSGKSKNLGANNQLGRNLVGGGR